MFPFPNILGAGSFSTWSPSDKAANVSLSSANLTATLTSAAAGGVRGSVGRSVGKYHFETTIGANGASVGYPAIGIADASFGLTSAPGVDAHAIEYQADGRVFFNNVQLASGLDTFTTADVLAFELDIGLSQVWVQKSGGTGRKGPYSISGIGAVLFPLFGSIDNADAVTLNVGASAFTITPTSGFIAWG